MTMFNYDTFPTEHMKGAVRRWIEDGITPGSFLSAVIANDLKDACARADDVNRHALFEIVRWFYNEAPAGCWGRPEALSTWRGTNSEDAAEAQAMRKE